MNIPVRPVRAGDYEAVCRLFAEGDEFHRRALPDLFRQAPTSRSLGYKTAWRKITIPLD